MLKAAAAEIKTRREQMLAEKPRQLFGAVPGGTQATKVALEANNRLK